MGKRGPAPVPTKILEIRGSWLAKTRSKEPKLSGQPLAVVVAPSWLSEDAKVVWKQVVADLKPLNILGHIDFHALARYCTLQVEWKKAVAFVQQHGSTLTQKDKGLLVMRLYPQARLMVALAQDLLRLEHEFGMTPSARASIGVEAARGTPDEGKIGKERFFA